MNSFNFLLAIFAELKLKKKKMPVESLTYEKQAVRMTSFILIRH